MDVARLGKTRWQDDFPMREEVEDFSGKKRVFTIRCHQGPLGFTLRAVEEHPKDEEGYEFGAYSETSPFSALGRLRDKMRRGLSCRHIAGRAGNFHMLHDRIRGHITTDSQKGVSLVVDGVRLSLSDIARILESHEGWNFELRISDSLE